MSLAGRLYDRYLHERVWNRWLWEPATRVDRGWEDARTLDDLGEMTARWLEGTVRRQPGYGGPCDVDDDVAPGLKDALIACNRAGFVTVQSQGGVEPYDPYLASWAAESGQQAAVIGLTDPDTAQLVAATMPAPIQVRVWDGAPRWGWQTRQAWEQTGCVFPPEDVAAVRVWFYGCHSDALTAAYSAWQVSIWDPEPGPNDLWPYLRYIIEGGG